MLNETDSFPASLRGQRRSQALREKYQDAKKGNRPNGEGVVGKVKDCRDLP